MDQPNKTRELTLTPDELAAVAELCWGTRYRAADAHCLADDVSDGLVDVGPSGEDAWRQLLGKLRALTRDGCVETLLRIEALQNDGRDEFDPSFKTVLTARTRPTGSYRMLEADCFMTSAPDPAPDSGTWSVLAGPAEDRDWAARIRLYAVAEFDRWVDNGLAQDQRWVENGRLTPAQAAERRAATADARAALVRQDDAAWWIRRRWAEPRGLLAEMVRRTGRAAASS